MTQEMSPDGSTLSRQVRLWSAVAYDGRSPMIAAARAFTAAFLQRARTRGVAVDRSRGEDAQLVVSELVTNAVRHAPGPCSLSLDLRDGRLTIAVSDTSPEQLAPRPFEPQRIGQHGLEIVLALCTGVGSEPTGDGKIVRATLPVA